MYLDVLAFVASLWDLRIQNVWNTQKDFLKRGLDFLKLNFHLFELITEGVHFREERGNILATGLGLANHLRARISLALKRLCSGLNLTTLRLKLCESRLIQFKAAASQLAGDLI
jgi:hypothetical protein